MNSLSRFLGQLGVLRSMLLAVTLVVIGCAPFADGKVHTGWMLGPSVIAPTIMAMLAFSLPLDMTMAKVFMNDKPVMERRRYKLVFWVELVLLLVMLAAWTPFVLRISGR